MKIFKYKSPRQGAKEAIEGFNLDELQDFRYITQEIPQASGDPILYRGLYVRLKGKITEKVQTGVRKEKGKDIPVVEKQEVFASHYIEDEEAIDRFLEMTE